MNLERHLVEQLKRSLSGKRPVTPAGGQLLWRWFRDLSRQRSYHAAGPNPIAFTEIEAYARLHRIPIEPRHVAILVAMDEAFQEHVQKRQASPPQGVKTMPPISTRPMTFELFDAITR